jgi:hypothetical protein
MNFCEILTFVRQRIKKLPESPFLHTYIYSNKLFNIRSQKQSTEGTVAKNIETDYKSAV